MPAAARSAGTGIALSGRRATGKREGEEEAAAGSEGTGSQRRLAASRPSEPDAGARGDPLGEADDRLTARIAAEEQADEERQERHCRQQEGAKLSQGGPG